MILNKIAKVRSKEIKDLDILRAVALKFYLYTVLTIVLIFLPFRIYEGNSTNLIVNLSLLAYAIVGLGMLKFNRHQLVLMYVHVFTHCIAISLILTVPDRLISSTISIVVVSLVTFCLLKNKQLGVFFLLLSMVIIAVLFSYVGKVWQHTIIILFWLYLLVYGLRLLITNLQKSLYDENQKNVTLNKNLLQKQNQLRLMTDSIVHDIKAPLQSIQGFSSLLEKEMSVNSIGNEKTKKYNSIINSSVQSLQNLVEELLNYSKLEMTELKMDKIDIAKLVTSELSKLQYQIENTNTIVNLKNLSFITGNESAIRMLLSNLISNAIKYQPKSDNHIPKLSIIQECQEDNNQLTIKDNGIGMDKKYLSTIFEPFKRLHNSSEYDGTGLGLAICQAIVNKHQGNITVESIQGYGTSFIITIPV